MPSCRVRSTVVASILALVGAGLAATTTAAQAAPLPPGSDPCPAAYPQADLVPGQQVTGLTSVDSGAPVEFTGTFVGTIDNGIADGLDMLVFDLEGPRLTNADGTVAAGNWSGISGSPVYDDASGALVGSVSYGFTSALSPRAGVTPAAYLYDLSSPTYSAAATTVTASRAEAAAIAKASSNPAPLGTGRILQPAKQVSGVNPTVANKIASKSRLLRTSSPTLSGGFRAGGGGGGSDADYPIVPGGSIALTSSTGTITTGLVGTVTAVCGNQVFALGHPGTFSGASTQTFNGAQTVAIQEDGVASPSFKIANIGRVKGVITQDRLQGVVGTLGQMAPAATVTTSSTAPRLASPKVSVTSVNDQASLPFVVASQVAGDATTVLNQFSSGDALMSWTITYTRSRSAGVKTFKRVQHYSTTEKLPDLVSFDVASDVESLLTNGFEKVRISSVAVSSALQPTYRALRPTRVQYLRSGKWRNAGRNGIKVKPGSTTRLRLRVLAVDSDSKAPPAYTTTTTFKASKNARGTGRALFTGQASSLSEDELFEDLLDELLEGPPGESERPSSLNEVLAAMAAQPRQDRAVGSFTYKTRGGKIERVRTVRAPSVVDGSVRVKLRFTK